MISTNIVCPLIDWCLHNTQKQLITRCRFKQLQLPKEEKEKLKIILKKGKITLCHPKLPSLLQLPISVLSTPNWSLGVALHPPLILVIKSEAKLLTYVAVFFLGELTGLGAWPSYLLQMVLARKTRACWRMVWTHLGSSSRNDVLSHGLREAHMSVWPRKLQGTREWIASKESLISTRECCGTTHDVA